MSIVSFFGRLLKRGGANKEEHSEGYNADSGATASICLGNRDTIHFSASSSFRYLQDEIWSIGLSNEKNVKMTCYVYLTKKLKTRKYKGYMTLHLMDIAKNKYKNDESYDNLNLKDAQEDDVELIITRITNQFVTGTFSGTLYAETGEWAVVTAGAFKVPVQ